MKKFVSLKLIVFSLLLVTGGLSYSAPAMGSGTGANSIVAGEDNEATQEKSSAFGYGNKAKGKFSLAFGYKNIADGIEGSAFGISNLAKGQYSSAFGFRNVANKMHSSAFGSGNEANGVQSSVFGFKNTVSGLNSSAFGSQYEVTGNSSGAFGTGEYNGQYPYKNEGNNSYMIGNKNKIASGSNDNFILGNNVTIGAGVQKSVVLGDGSASGGSNTVSVGSSTLQRKIVNVADGTISATSTDAVTGRQLYSGDGIDVNKWRTKLGVSSGGGASGGAPGDAYTKSEADNKFTSKDDYKDANGIDVDKWKAKLGTGASSTDIKNLRNEVNEKIDNVKDEVRGVGSLSAALAGLHPMQYDPKAPAQVMAALGHYKDRQAVAVGASYYFNDKFMMSTGVALSGEKRTEAMANVGFTLKIGKGSGTTYTETPQYVVQNEVKRLTVENQELKERVRNLEEKLNMLLKNK